VTLCVMGSGGRRKLWEVDHERRVADATHERVGHQKRGEAVETVGRLDKMSLGGSDQHQRIFQR
jgi:hypothetical protein